MDAYNRFKTLTAQLNSEFAIADSKEEVNKSQQLRIRNLMNEMRKLAPQAKADSVALCKGE